MRRFGENVRWLRTQAGLTQRELAARVHIGRRRSGCDASYIAYIESGERDPRLSTIRSLARALHVKPWHLLADLTDNTEFWDGYLRLKPEQKREIQRMVKWYTERRV